MVYRFLPPTGKLKTAAALPLGLALTARLSPPLGPVERYGILRHLGLRRWWGRLDRLRGLRGLLGGRGFLGGLGRFGRLCGLGWLGLLGRSGLLGCLLSC